MNRALKGNDMKNRIGLVTLHNYNYGSALQCYSTVSYFQKLGFEVRVLEEKKKNKIKVLLSLFSLCVAHPFSIKAIYEQVKSESAKRLTLSSDSLAAIDIFNRAIFDINLIDRDIKSQCDFFLVGSDQVWNGRRCFGYNKYFLRFAPKDKRYSLAASFGGAGISKFNKRRFKRGFKSFKKISVREKASVSFINQLTGRTDVQLLCDTIFLKSKEEWSQLASTNISLNKFALLFFIDKPSSELIAKLEANKDYTYISVGYYYKEFERLNVKHLDGGPELFLEAIMKSDLVLTDSFHATAFSILFNKEFYSFTRNYQHTYNQSSRLLELLEGFKISNRFDNFNLNCDPIKYFDVNKSIEENRKKVEAFLESIINEHKD